ncbi:unnamed protein product, partial [Pylaiella littoralis]
MSLESYVVDERIVGTQRLFIQRGRGERSWVVVRDVEERRRLDVEEQTRFFIAFFPSVVLAVFLKLDNVTKSTVLCSPPGSHSISYSVTHFRLFLFAFACVAWLTVVNPGLGPTRSAVFYRCSPNLFSLEHDTSCLAPGGTVVTKNRYLPARH